MNKKSESHALYDDAIQTTYATRNFVGSKEVDGLIVDILPGLKAEDSFNPRPRWR
jgi:hypothetical protein